MAASKNFPRLPSNWTETQFHILENSIFCRAYLKQGHPQKALFIVHGQGEQSDRYEHFAEYLKEDIDAIFTFDLPGHGQSKGIRGHIQNFDEYSAAAVKALEAFQLKFPNCEIHWFGHSLGGLISLRTLFKFPNLKIRSVIISAPLLGLALPVPYLKKKFGEIVSSFLGFIKLSNEIDGSLVSRDASVVQEYSLNPLNHAFVTPSFFVNMTKELEQTSQNRGPFSYSLFMCIPMGDRIVSADSSIAFYQHLELKNGLQKELLKLDGFYHESFNDIGKEKAFAGLKSWFIKMKSEGAL